MTSAQTLSNHTTFSAKQKPLHLSDSKEHQYSTNKQIGELETLSRLVSQHNLRTSTVTRKSLRNTEHSSQLSQILSTAPTSENSRKSDTSPQASSESGIQTKGRLAPSRSSAKQDKMVEEVSSDKSSLRHDPSKTRKSSEDLPTYNTRRHSKTTDHAMEIEDTKSQGDNKKSVGEMITGQQAGGYHLRSTGHKSGHRDTSFSDDFEYEYPGRNPSNTDASSNLSANIRNKTARGPASTNDDNSNQLGGETTSQKGGSGSKNSNSKRTRRPSIQSILCTEEISTFEIPNEMFEKKRVSERHHKEIRELEESNLKCTEELEDVKEDLRLEENYEYIEVTRSPPGSRNDNSRRRGKKCFNKLCLTSPNNPLLWAKEKVRGSCICKTCYEAYTNDQFCYFCYQIYLDDDKTTASDDKDWIGCDSCGVWNHIQCEEKNGTKGLAVLSSKNKNYKYYCPRCRVNTNNNKNTKSKLVLDFLEVPTTTSRGNTSPKHSYPTTPKRGQNIQNGKAGNPRPALDDWLACEEGLEEPAFTKIRINNDRKGNTVEVSVTGETDDREEEEEEDITKKKLDSIFTKNNGRRRVQFAKPVTTTETFTELDKLMTQYGGKKAQLTEQEIKADLIKIRDVSKTPNGLQLNTELSVSESAMDNISEMSGMEIEGSSLQLKNGTRSSKSQKKSSRGKEKSVTKNAPLQLPIPKRDEKNGREKATSSKEENSSTAPRMQLRTRKMN